MVYYYGLISAAIENIRESSKYGGTFYLHHCACSCPPAIFKNFLQYSTYINRTQHTQKIHNANYKYNTTCKNYILIK